MHHTSTFAQLASLGTELNTNQYRAVQLAARYEEELDWHRQGHTSAAAAIAVQLQLRTSTAREWIRVGHTLRDLPHIDDAFRTNQISYAKVRILTRWADPENEEQLLSLAHTRTANRLTTAVAATVANNGETDDERDQRHHDARGFTTYTDGDGMVVIRIVVPPTIAKPLIAAVDQLVDKIARTPQSTTRTAAGDASAATKSRPGVTTLPKTTTRSDQPASADAPSPRTSPPIGCTLDQLQTRWQPNTTADHSIPTLSQQRADAFAVLFLQKGIHLTTEVVIHIRGEGNTFDDGTPITNNAIARQLDHAFIRLMIHDAERNPIDATNRRRHPTTRQKRVVMEAHNSECVDCSTTNLIEFDHNPPYEQTHHTITAELEPRCAPCHRARHRSVA